MHAPEVRPILRTRDQSVPNRILADVLPLLRVTFAVTQPVMKTAGLKFPNDLVGRCCRAAMTFQTFCQPVFPETRQRSIVNFKSFGAQNKCK